jgi:hypothetical protein
VVNETLNGSSVASEIAGHNAGSKPVAKSAHQARSMKRAAILAHNRLTLRCESSLPNRFRMSRNRVDDLGTRVEAIVAIWDTPLSVKYLALRRLRLNQCMRVRAMMSNRETVAACRRSDEAKAVLKKIQIGLLKPRLWRSAEKTD